LNRLSGSRAAVGPKAGIAVGVLLAGVALAGCTKAPSPSVSPTAAPSSADQSTVSSQSSTASGSATASSGSDSSASATKPSSSPPSKAPSSSATSKPAGPLRPACATSALTITVQRGSGAAGHQFASIVFTNKSAAVCSLTGFPGAALVLGTAPLGKPAARSTLSFAEVDLAPHAVASALLTNISTCNAANSDSVQVIVPNQTQPVLVPLQFRGCGQATIDPVRAGDGS
jgi:hypothetical protein